VKWLNCLSVIILCDIWELFELFHSMWTDRTIWDVWSAWIGETISFAVNYASSFNWCKVPEFVTRL
jgi:hypothetical protein